MFLGIEIGGTKLQFGVGDGDGTPMATLQRERVDPKRGAEGIREQIRHCAGPLIERYGVSGIGIGFGGPVESASGRIIKSHQVGGWDDFPMADWARKTLGLPVVVGNDSDLAGLAEARFGAGRGHRIVVYNNIGSGIGGALVINGQLYPGSCGIATEIGHLRPGLQSDRPDQTVESLASGWAIAAAAQARASDPVSHRLGPFMAGDRPRGPESVRQQLIEREEVDERWAADLLERCEGHLERLTTEALAKAAGEGNELARDVFLHACQTLGWALGQVITLLAPNVLVIGGGVSLVGEELFLAPLRQEVERYVFPPLLGTYHIVQAKLGEDVVVFGALANAAGKLP
jgi:glucokinase